MKVYLLFLVSAAFTTGCMTPERAERSPQGRLLNEAVAYFADLQCHDKIPGWRNGEHGKLETDVLPLRREAISYPVSVGIRVTKRGDDAMYSYTVVKDTADSTWRLASAKRLDKDGHVVEGLVPK